MTELHFEEPPETAHPIGKAGEGRHWEAAAELRKEPGRYALVGTYPNRSTAASMAYVAREGKINAYAPKGAFHAVSRTVDGEFRLYVKYVGEQEQGASDGAAE